MATSVCRFFCLGRAYVPVGSIPQPPFFLVLLASFVLFYTLVLVAAPASALFHESCPSPAVTNLASENQTHFDLCPARFLVKRFGTQLSVPTQFMLHPMLTSHFDHLGRLSTSDRFPLCIFTINIYPIVVVLYMVPA